MSADYRAAIIGCGRIAGLHAEGYLAEPRCEVVALVDVDEPKARAFAEEHGLGAATVYTDYRKMLEGESPDIVSVCLWPELHGPVSVECAQASVKAVHCEKPVAPSWGESVELATAFQEAGTQLTFNHQRRFTPGIVKAKEMLDEGRFGTLERMDLFAPAHLLDCGTHSIDLGIMYNGDGPVQWAIGQIDARQVRSWFNTPCEFMAVGMFRFENGVRATIHVGDDKEIGTGVRLIGSSGFIEVAWDGSYGRAVVYDEPQWQPPEVEEGSPMPGVFRNLVDCLESGEEPELSARKALRATEVVFAIYESSRRRARIDLPLQAQDSALASMLEAGEVGPTPGAGGD